MSDKIMIGEADKFSDMLGKSGVNYNIIGPFVVILMASSALFGIFFDAWVGIATLSFAWAILIEKFFSTYVLIESIKIKQKVKKQ